MGRPVGVGMASAVVASGVVTLFAVAAPGDASLGPAGAGASRIVDRTFVCAVSASQPGYPDATVRHRAIGLGTFRRLDEVSSKLASVGDSYGHFPLLYLNVGGPRRYPDGTVAVGLALHAKRCAWQRAARVPLSRTPRLRAVRLAPNTGSLTPGVEARRECNVPRRILIRVRARLGRPALWVRSERLLEMTTPLLGLRTNVIEASVAIRTAPAGAPLAFLRLARNKHSFYAAPRCTA